MDLLEQAREKLNQLLHQSHIDHKQSLHVRPLHPDEAIGANASSEFVIKKGKERVIEANYGEYRGQAFTDQPIQWSGSIHEFMHLDLSSIPNRAIFVAGLNALVRRLDLSQQTIHCLDNKPSECGPEMARFLQSNYEIQNVGLIGLQPAILKALAETFGDQNVRVLDLNPDNIGTRKHNILIENGDTDFPKIVAWCDLGLATGSTIVNGSINTISAMFQEAEKDLLFFGNTISGPRALLGFNHYCPFGR
ncbi:hypothetical protein GF373_02800 [bacterium]|nr:hypothetical protein [bacterium]